MGLVHINWKPDAKQLRQFGWAMLIGFTLIGAICQFVISKPLPFSVTRYIYGFAVVAGLLGLSGTRAALPVYWAWMAVGFVMGNVISRVLVAAFFYLLITPMGLVMRLFGRDKLHLREPASTTWVDLSPPGSKESYERQF